MKRLDGRGRINRDRTITFTWDGREMSAHPGDTVASALLANGVKTTVPTHVVTGTRIVISTADGTYVERAKD